MRMSCDLTSEQKIQLEEERYRWLYQRVGTRVSKTKFLVLPKKLYNPAKDCTETRWLERADIIITLKHWHWWDPPRPGPDRYIFYGLHEAFEWVETEWEND